MAETAHMTSKNRVTFGVSVTPAQLRAIEELMLLRREFSRSRLMVEATLEVAERELPGGWRKAAGIEDGEAA